MAGTLGQFMVLLLLSCFSRVRLCVTPQTAAHQAPSCAVNVNVNVKSLSRVRLFATPWTVAYQAPLSMGFFQAIVLEWIAMIVFKQPFGFPGGSEGKESAWNAGDPSSIPGLRRSPGVGNGNSLQYCCLENSMDKGAWRVTVHGVTRS